jgi:hypothetical protein
MKIKMLTRYAGPLGCFEVGQDPNLPDSEKAALVMNGFALSCSKVEAAIETAMTSGAEENTAVTPKQGTAGRVKR